MRVFLLCFSTILLLSAVFCKTREKTLDNTLQQAVAWMWKQQSPDGGWHSKTHAVLRDGRVLTPYILFYLLQLPEKEFPINQKSVDRTVEFIIKEMRSSLDGDSLTLTDYPNYSAAYSLRVLHLLNRDTSLQQIIAEYLLRQQFNEQRGFSPDHLVYGGWGYGEDNLGKGEFGHVDISHTRRVAEALFESEYLDVKAEADDFAKKLRHPKEAKAKENILHFIKGVQRHPEDLRCYEGCISRTALPYDGGFVASVVTLATNKSEAVYIDSAGYHYPSYATATCDGFMLMNTLSMEETHYYQDAKKWLLQNQQTNTIDGLSVDDPEQWAEVMHYYHLAVRSEVMSMIDSTGSWRESIKSILIEEQLPEGYYINVLGGVNKEDDPLMATILAIQACERVRK